MYNIFQETVVDQARNSLNANKAPKINQEILNVRYEDFTDYIQNIKKVFEVYKKNNAIKTARQREKQLINISECLLECYKIVKPSFFDDKYVFDFSYLTRNIRVLCSTQEEVCSDMPIIY